MDLSQFRLLVTIADHGGFSQAARVLHMSQPAVSAQIRQLEQRAGIPLLERRGRTGALLTPAGEVAYQFGKELLTRYDELLVALDKVKRGTLGDLTVGASYTCYTYILPRILREFRLSFPDVRLFSTTGTVPEITEAVRRRQSSMGIVWGPVNGEFTSYPLLDEPFYVVARPDHPLARKGEIQPKELEPCPFVLDVCGSSTRAFVEETFHQAKIQLLQPIEFGTPFGSKEGILAGLGIGILSRSAMAREVADGLLCPLKVKSLAMRRNLVLLHRPDTQLSAHAETFRTFIIKQLQTFAQIHNQKHNSSQASEGRDTPSLSTSS